MRGRLLVLCGAAAPLAAQDLPLKRGLPAATDVACPAIRPSPAPVRSQIDEANRLITLGGEAALEGDHQSARALFLQAAQLNQTDASLAYRLGREHEAVGDKPAAVLEYCRYLYLSPTAGDAGQIRDKLTALMPTIALRSGTAMVERFRDGIEDYDHGEWAAAAESFADVTAVAPGFAPAVFNRALALARAHHQAAAIREFDRYLALLPDAADRAAVQERQDELRRQLPSATTAFWLGLVPGAGQYYTRQPLAGLLVTGAAAGAVVWGAQAQTVKKTATFTDSNGHPYQQTFPATEHKNLPAGIGAAAGVTLLGAIEAAIVAHNRSSSLPPVTVVASRGQVGLGFEFR